MRIIKTVEMRVPVYRMQDHKRYEDIRELVITQAYVHNAREPNVEVVRSIKTEREDAKHIR
jgi:hypothetical protein